MVPTIGRVVIYRTTEKERDGLKALGYCNSNIEVPAIIVAAWGNTPTSAVNLKVMLDGQGDIWKTSVCVGENEGSWHWPIITPSANFTITGNVNTSEVK